MKVGKLSKRQHFYSWIVKKLAGDEFEERVSNLLPEEQRIKGFRLWLYWQFVHLQVKEGARLVKEIQNA